MLAFVLIVLLFGVFFFCSQWFNVLNRVHRATEEELKGMREESANVKHAVVRLFISCALFVRISISTV